MNSPSLENYPKTFEEYTERCKRMEVEPLLDETSFRQTVTLLEMNDALADPRQRRALLQRLTPQTEEDILEDIGAAVHLSGLAEDDPHSPLVGGADEVTATLNNRPTGIEIVGGQVIGVPQGNVVKFAGQIKDGDAFVIHVPKDGSFPADLAMLIGPADALKLASNVSIDMNRDGGTLLISSDQGFFYFPKRSSQGNPYWQANTSDNEVPVTFFVYNGKDIDPGRPFP
jgi:hypothetical protein